MTLLSVLVATLESRRASFEALEGTLRAQIARDGLEGAVEVVALRDAGERSVGWKRNELIRRAVGEYVVFVDDDDDVHPSYLALIVAALREHPGVDVLGIRGEVAFRASAPRAFVMSLRYDAYRTRRGCYERPPHHLNPMRREIAARYPFEDVRRHEDSDWALRIARDRAIRTEHMLEPPLYLYRSRRFLAHQLALDHTEWLRHPLGLQLVNLVRLRRRLRRSAARSSG